MAVPRKTGATAGSYWGTNRTAAAGPGGSVIKAGTIARTGPAPRTGGGTMGTKGTLAITKGTVGRPGPAPRTGGGTSPTNRIGPPVNRAEGMPTRKLTGRANALTRGKGKKKGLRKKGR